LAGSQNPERRAEGVQADEGEAPGDNFINI